jgi:hypothetical protein
VLARRPAGENIGVVGLEPGEKTFIAVSSTAVSAITKSG